MKRLMFLCVLFFTTQLVNAQVKEANLVASGLTCSMCSKAIYEALKNISTVENVKANIKESSYNIVFKNGANADPDAIKKAVEDAGFFVAKLQLKIKFNDVTVKNDEHITAAGLNLHFLDIREQQLNGEKLITVVDKNFEPAKEFKKYAQFTSMKCLTTGKAESCCADGKIAAGERIYHVTI
ncbi:heavy-metal-associated domain-containing protein [Panacibacter sp. DH6]|uniref:Heavy-metal-associated domain-containing protein n=1 Tax=Panacibacter microcysteis TaxID=2793269 RepID=A0A931GZ51_9BACT|nr:heavy-metal-associated domain-containing protein [Panacibacter microcysteis]MBG9378032.1 heavy-metal-associated domain-containing protein [Panacibacter microcysteis]